VIALDGDERRVDAVADVVAQARVANGTDLNVLSELRVDAMSAVMNAIGDEFLLDSILCTALLRQLGAPRLIARATNEVHARVLKAIGADEIIQPEREIGKVVARRIARSGLVNQFDLGDNMTVIEIAVPERWLDKTLADLDLRRQHAIQVAAVRRSGGREWLPPDPEEPFARGDHVLALGKQDTIEGLVRGALR
jgi:trk system potassium uptake protein TrkA